MTDEKSKGKITPVTFKTEKSPVEPKEIMLFNTKADSTNVFKDLFRMKDGIFIDKISLSQIIKENNGEGEIFDSKKTGNYSDILKIQKNAEEFFKNYLIKKLPEEHKEAAIDHLSITLHQGGYLSFSSIPLIEHLAKNKIPDKTIPSIYSKDLKLKTSISTNPSGFEISSEMSTKKINDNDKLINGYHVADDDSGFNFLHRDDKLTDEAIVIHKAKISVDFIKNSRTLISSEIAYKSKGLKKFITSRKNPAKEEKSEEIISIPLEKSKKFYMKELNKIKDYIFQENNEEEIKKLERKYKIISNKIFEIENSEHMNPEIIDKNFIELYELERQYSSLAYAKEETLEIKKRDVKKSAFKVMEESEVEKEDIKKNIRRKHFKFSN